MGISEGGLPEKGSASVFLGSIKKPYTDYKTKG